MAHAFRGSKPKLPRVLLNIGALMDIPTGMPAIGARGETFINGGLHYTTGIVGVPNSFKSTIMHYMAITAADRVYSAYPTSLHTYDTELTLSISRLESLASRAQFFPDMAFDPHDPIWDITSKDQYAADEWLVELKKFVDEKAKDVNGYVEFQPFASDKQKKVMLPVPTFTEVDSVAEFEAETTIDMLESSKKDDSSTNTLFMKQGLFKTKFFSMVPRMAVSSNTYFLFSSHIGEELAIGASPYAPGPTKKLAFLKTGQKIKGVSDKFLFLVGNAWYAKSNRVLKNQNTKLAEYPIGKDDAVQEELALVGITQLRGKSGMSGYTLELVISQNEGVLPALTEFHFVKSYDRYGMGGSAQNYFMILYPDAKLQRTNVRTKLDTDPKLCRAVNITSELLQITHFWRHLIDPSLICTPEELYNDIKELGYDWDVLLDTRGWYALNQYDHPIPFLSTIDLLKMRKGLYHPYWMEPKKK